MPVDGGYDARHNNSSVPRNALPVPARKIGSPPWLQEVTSEGHL
jgi:hypothetical protein